MKGQNLRSAINLGNARLMFDGNLDTAIPATSLPNAALSQTRTKPARCYLLAWVSSCIVIAGLAASLAGQSLIKGTITDGASRTGLAGANVQIQGTVLGAATDPEGAFAILNIPAGTYTLRVSIIGYQTVRVTAIVLHPHDSVTVDIELQEAYIEIDPIVVTASKWQQQAAHTPATVEVLTARDIMSRNPIRIEDALEAAAGVQIVQENVVIRGSDGYTRGVGSRVLVMIDGIPVMNSDFGAINWFMISPADIERAEIVRGAGSALYGSSAVGGVINFITRRPAAKSRTYIRTVLGAFDDPYEEMWDFTDQLLDFNRQDVTHSRQIGDLGLRVSAGRSVSSGYVENGDYERYNLSGKLNYRFRDASDLTLFGNYMHDDSGVFIVWKDQDEALRVPPQELDKRQTQSGLSLFAKYKRLLSATHALEVRMYYNRFLLGTQFTTAGTFSPALGMGFTVQGNYIPMNALNIVYGAEFRFDMVQSAKTLYGERDALLGAPFAQLDLEMGSNLNLTLGGRYDRYEIRGDTEASLGEARSYSHFSPKIGLNYRPFAETTLRASVANGFKFPYVAQLFLEFDSAAFRFLSNPNLQSEVSWTYELGVRHKINTTWFVELNGFLTRVDNLIEIEPLLSGDVKFVNINRARIPGIELTTNGRWFDNRLGFKANILLIDPRDRTIDQLLRYRQKFSAFLAPSLRLGDVELQVDFKYASAQERYSLPGIHQLVPQKVLDARVFFYSHQNTFFIGVNNIQNYNYTLRDRSVEEIRNFVAGFATEF